MGENLCVRKFLGKYSESTQYNFRRYLCMFFKWLRIRKGLELKPDEFLQLLSEKRQSKQVQDKCWRRNLVLEFKGNNPDLKGKSYSLRYGAMFKSVNLFCKAHEVELTSARGVYGEKKHRKYRPAPYTIALAKKVLAEAKMILMPFMYITGLIAFAAQQTAENKISRLEAAKRKASRTP